MATTTRYVDAEPAAVHAVLDDGWLYPLWVVGAARIRAVDASWPEPGSALHHSVGAWPLLRNDTTEVVERDPGRSLTLRANVWPAGSARVHITVTAHGAASEVVIVEDAESGPLVLVPERVRDLAFDWRNTETLRRLALLAERRQS